MRRNGWAPCTGRLPTAHSSTAAPLAECAPSYMTMWTGTMCGLAGCPHNTFNSNRHTNMKIISKNDSRQAGVGRRRGVVLHANSTASGNLAAWADSASQAQAGTSLPSSTNEMLKIYLVEDSPVIRENLAETLGELAEASVVGYADSEDDAKSWLANNSGAWHLAIVDLFLKRGNGLPVLRALGARRPHQKVVVLSNYASPEIRAECVRLGADAVFDKSTDVDELMEFCLAMRRDDVDGGTGGSNVQ